MSWDDTDNGDNDDGVELSDKQIEKKMIIVDRIKELELKLSQEQARGRRLREALEEIEKMRGMTLLGRCCVKNECITDDEGTACEVRLKAHSAFNQAADVARAALAETGDAV